MNPMEKRDHQNNRTQCGLTAAAAVAGVAVSFTLFLSAPVSARAEIYGNVEPEIDFSDISENEELPEELRDKVLTEDLQQALQEAWEADQTDPEAILDAQGLPDSGTGEEASSGEMIDPTDGSPIVLFGDSEAITFNKLSLTEHPPLEVSYDSERKRFVYEFPNGADFSMTAPLGGIANEPVTLEAGEGMEILGLWVNEETILTQAVTDTSEESEEAAADDRDDIVIEGDRITVSRLGNIQFTMFSDGVSNGEVEDSYMMRGSVRILSYDEQVRYGYIGTPPGFTLSLITCNGEKLATGDPYGVRLTRDGNYQLLYNLGKTQWSCSFRRDTTPPMLLFSESLDEGPFRHEVSWQTYRPNTDVRVFWNNNEITAPDNTVIVDGWYRIEAYDAAGNAREYQFGIAKGMRLHPEYLLPVLGALILFGAVVILFYRRRLKVL